MQGLQQHTFTMEEEIEQNLIKNEEILLLPQHKNQYKSVPLLQEAYIPSIYTKHTSLVHHADRAKSCGSVDSNYRHAEPDALNSKN